MAGEYSIFWRILLCFLVFGGGTLAGQTRLIPHVTAPGGGFSTTVVLENVSELDAGYALQPYDRDGRVLPRVSGTVEAFATVQVGTSEIFGPSNAVSHFVIVESSENVLVRVAYEVAAGRGSPAHMAESIEQKRQWRLFAGEWDTVFDGIAVVNMGSAATDVTISQISDTGVELQTETVILDLAPMAKGLYVIGGPSGSVFSSAAGGYFLVSASQNLAITALRGTPPGAPVGILWENEVDTNPVQEGGKRLVSHVTRPGGGFSSMVLAENRTNSSKRVSVQPYDQDGNALSLVEIPLQGYETAAWPLEGLFGDDAAQISHFQVTEGSAFVRFGVSYRIASGPGSPAQVRESNLQKSCWRFFPGDWNEVFDGFAVVNAGELPADVVIEQIALDGRVVHCELALKNLPPMAKGLYVVGGPQGSSFVAPESTYFELASSEPVAVTVLRGTPPGAPVGYLWKNQATFFDDLRKADQILARASESRGGEVCGFLFQTPQWVVVDDATNAPSGAWPVAGAQITIRDASGVSIATTLTAADGSFFVDQIPYGCHVVEAGHAGTPGAVELQMQFSCLNWETVSLGGRHEISRQAAIDSVSGTWSETDLVLGTLNPLPSGTHLRPFGDPAIVRASGQIRVLESPAWFFVVDHAPFQQWAHPVTYVLVDAATGTVTQTEGVNWAPLVNHFPYWTRLADFARVAEVNPPQVEDTWEADLTPLDEVVHMPMHDGASAAEVFETYGFLKTLLSTGAGDVFVLVIKGDDAPVVKSDSARFVNFLIRNGVPHGQGDPNIKIMDTSQYADAMAVKQVLAQQIAAINAEIAKRLNENPKRYSTFLIYINSHGGPEVQPGPGRQTGWFSIKAQNGGPTHITARELADMTIKGTKACKVRFVVDICFAAWFSEDLLEVFFETDLDFISYHAAGRHKEAESNWEKVDIGGGQERVTFRGGKFITPFLDHASLGTGDLTGVLVKNDEDELDLIPAVGSLDQEPGWFPGPGEYQPKDPPWCREQTSLNWTPDPAQTEFTAGVPCSGWEYPVGRFLIANPDGTFTVDLAGGSEDPCASFAFANPMLPAGSETPFWVFYQCENPGNLTFDFWVSVTGPDGTPVLTEFAVPMQRGPDLNAIDLFGSVFYGVPPEQVPWPQWLEGLGLSDVPIHHLMCPTPVNLPCITTECTMATHQVQAVDGEMTAELLRIAFGFGEEKAAPNFPCGPGPFGLTVCTSSPRDGDPGDYIFISNVLREPFDVADAVQQYQFGFVFESDGDPNNNYVPAAQYARDFYRDTDRWYSVEYSPATGWVLEVTDARGGNFRPTPSAARVIIRENVVMLVVPRSEFPDPNPTFRVTSFTHTGDFGFNPPYDWSGDLWPFLDDPLAPITHLGGR